LCAHIDKLDFSIFHAILTLRVIDGHAKTRWHVTRFVGGLPEHSPLLVPPATASPSEATYLRHLLAGR
jgi:hypothetical protein